MRVLIVDTYYPPFLASHYGDRPGLAARSYDEQLRSLLDRSFGTGDAYSRNLTALGHEAAEVIPNAAALQLQWAREHGTARGLRLPGPLGSRRRALAVREALDAQLEDFRPDVVYAQDLSVLGRARCDHLRARGVFVAGQIASPAPDAETLGGYDLLVSSFPHFVERFRSQGLDAAYLPLAFDEKVLETVTAGRSDEERDLQLSFVGGLGPDLHGGRVALLERVSEAAGASLWGYGIDGLPPGSPIRRCHQGEAWGLDMYAVLARSRIVVNRHVDVAEGYANNMRLFEATGMGALLMTEAAPNLADLFEPGREVVAYTDADDLIEKVRHYGQNEDERRRIAAAGQERTLTDHTYAKRIPELAAILAARVR